MKKVEFYTSLSISLVVLILIVLVIAAFLPQSIEYVPQNLPSSKDLLASLNYKTAHTI